MTPTLTDIERKILDYMVQYLRSNTYQPSIREIGERFGIKSTKTVSEHLQALADKGFLERDPSRSRGVKILDVDLSVDAVAVPCYRDVPTDRGTRPRAETHISLDRRLAGARGSFFVRAHGNELASLGVIDGDFVLLEPCGADELIDKDIVAIQIGERADFLRVGKNGRGVTLHALGGSGDVTHVEDALRLPVVGKISALFRRLDGEGVPVSQTSH